MGSLLCLPHANVDVERVFSSVNLIKTKIRNRLHTKTVGALLKVKRGIAKEGSCVNFTPPPGAKARMTADILYAVSDSDSDSYLAVRQGCSCFMEPDIMHLSNI